MSPWACTKCTFVNDEDDGAESSIQCGMCQESRATAAEGEVVRRCRESMQFSELALLHSDRKKNVRTSSLSALANMSFAAWESDRQEWTCKACTFVNDPRFLMCGACGIADGSTEIGDELITAGLGHMSLSSAQKLLIENVHHELNSGREDSLRKERIEELQEDISKSEKDSKLAKAWHDIGVLERVQRAEQEEHENIQFMLDEWRDQLDPNAEQEEDLSRQEELLNTLRNEWNAREKDIKKLKMRLEENQEDS